MNRYTNLFSNVPRRIATLLAIGGWLAVTSPAFSTAISWTGASGGAWNTASNWSPASVPGSSDDATINLNGRINLATTAASVNSITLGDANSKIAGASDATNATKNLTIGAGGLTHSASDNTSYFRIPTITLDADQTWNISGTATLTGTLGTVTAAEGFTIAGASPTVNTLNLNGHDLTKAGNHQLSVGGVNITGNGDINIDAGSLRLAAANNQGASIGGTGTIRIASKAGLLLGANSSDGTGDVTISSTRTIQMNGGGSIADAAIIQYGSATSALTDRVQTIAAGIQFTGAGFTVLDLNDQATNSLARSWKFTGNWTGSGTVRFTTNSSSDTGHLSYTYLGGDNSGLTGVIENAQSHTNRAVVFESVNAGSANAEWRLSNANAIYRLVGTSVSLGALSGTAGKLINDSPSTAATATLGGKNIDTTFGGTIVNGNTAALAITKVGTGVQELTNTNTYTGATLISNGTLRLAGTGSINGTSGITINGAGARFITNSSVAVTKSITLTSGLIGGTGAINTAVTIGANGTISPGNSPGTQAYLSGLTWATDGTYLWEVDQVDTSSISQSTYKGTDPGADWLNITGTLNITATSGNPFTIDITGLAHGTHNQGAVGSWDNTKDYTWTIATASLGVTGFDASVFALNTSNFTSNNAINGSFSITADANNVYLNYTAVPEPGTFAMLLFGSLALWLFRRQR